MPRALCQKLFDGAVNPLKPVVPASNSVARGRSFVIVNPKNFRPLHTIHIDGVRSLRISAALSTAINTPIIEGLKIPTHDSPSHFTHPREPFLGCEAGVIARLSSTYVTVKFFKQYFAQPLQGQTDDIAIAPL